MYHVVMWFTQTTTQKQTTLLNVFVLFFGRQTHGKGKQKSNNQYYFISWKAIIIERKWHVKEKTSSLTVIQVQVYRPMVMEPHIDEGSLILWSSSPTLMNTKKKKKDLHVNHPSKNPILKKKKIKTLRLKNYNDLPRIRWTKHIKVKETKLEADKIRNSPNQEKRTDQAPKIKKMIYNNWIDRKSVV